ncbi:hypothetical protein Hanom_Chr14g01322621 [Helianthus anomalus]
MVLSCSPEVLTSLVTALCNSLHSLSFSSKFLLKKSLSSSAALHFSFSSE